MPKPNLCKFDGCKKQAAFNIETEKRGKYCFTHKETNMINVIRKICIHDNCQITSTYNILGSPPLYCKSHKELNMINVTSRLCAEINCQLRPSYNYKGTRGGIFCNRHKKENMVDVVSDICIYNDCTILACYNYTSEIKRLYCNEHKKDGMVNIKDKKCLELNCDIIPNYNYLGAKKGIYCALHKKENMMNVNSKCCQYDSCYKQPVFNYENQKNGIYCNTHKLDGMINIKSPTCKTELCDIVVLNNKYNGYCLRCFVYLFPDKPTTRNYKTKERTIVEYIKSQFTDKTIIADKTITGSCSKRRPDILIDMATHVIIIEIDENQHKKYDCSCENKRLMELSQDIEHRPLIVIRFNPDEYLNIDNVNITSCWGSNKQGLPIIKKIKQKEWEERLLSLKEQINYWINNQPLKTIEIIQLYYDCNIK